MTTVTCVMVDQCRAPLKRCTCCGNEFPCTPEFWQKQPLLIGGLRNQCKSCYRAARRTRRHADPAKARAIQKKERSTEQYRAHHRAYETERRWRNIEAFRAYRRKYY